MTDFGLAKIIEPEAQARSYCGTLEYMAPEILQDQGHSFQVDWWALGIITYEMIVGFTPYSTGARNQRNEKKMLQAILTKPVKFPDPIRHGIKMSPECQAFIRELLNIDPNQRLGSQNEL